MFIFTSNKFCRHAYFTLIRFKKNDLLLVSKHLACQSIVTVLYFIVGTYMYKLIFHCQFDHINPIYGINPKAWGLRNGAHAYLGFMHCRQLLPMYLHKIYFQSIENVSQLITVWTFSVVILPIGMGWVLNKLST